MGMVLFEVEPKPEQWEAYLAHAAALRPGLLRIDGFLDNRRFTSVRRPGVLLSLSLWRDEAALITWRGHGRHHVAQTAGRDQVFRDYRLRVGEVADDAAPDRAASVIESPAWETPPGIDGLDGWDRFDGITEPGASLMLLSWRDGSAMRGWPPAGGARRTDVAIRRDYGMRDRGEAPQIFPPVDL